MIGSARSLVEAVVRSGGSDRRGPLSKHGPKYLRWALLEATMHALRHPAYSERHQHTKRRLGKQRGAKVAQVEIARRLTRAIWHMLTGIEPLQRRSSGGRRSQLQTDPRPVTTTASRTRWLTTRLL